LGANNKVKKAKKPKNTNFPTEAAFKVIMGLKRRQNKSISWFLQPVSDKAILADYRSKVRRGKLIARQTCSLARAPID
jgi:hypothetical protein